MPGTVLYRPTPAQKLPYGPVSAYFGPTGNITWLIDDAQIDPLLGHALIGLGNIVVSLLGEGLTPSKVRFHRCHQLGGSELVAAEISDAIDVLMPWDLVTREVTRQLGLHGTTVLQELLRMPHICGRGTPPPAA